MIRDIELAKLKTLVSGGNADPFYNWRSWKHLSEEVKKLDNYECQICKAKGRYSRGEIVHHVKHVKDRPDLALSVYDTDTHERQLITLCRDCHRQQHPEQQRQYKPAQPPATLERWD